LEHVFCEKYGWFITVKEHRRVRSQAGESKGVFGLSGIQTAERWKGPPNNRELEFREAVVVCHFSLLRLLTCLSHNLRSLRDPDDCNIINLARVALMPMLLDFIRRLLI
jgi:hypothetical protein